MALSLFVADIAAEDALFVCPVDGSSIQSVLLDNIQRITFDDDNMLLETTDGDETSFLLAIIGKITFDEPKKQVEEEVSVVQNKLEINLYPNPSTDYVFIDSSADIVSWTLFNFSGSIMKHSASDLKIQVSDLSSGIYLLKIDTADGTVIKKIVKQ